MKTNQKDILNTVTNAEETSKENSTSVYKPIEETPFIMRCIDNQWFITVNKWRITDKYETEEEALAELEWNKWHVITALINISIDVIEEHKKEHGISPLQGLAHLRKKEMGTDEDDRPE